MNRKSRTIRLKPTPDADYEIRVVGARPTPLRDFYHVVLTYRWGPVLAIIAGIFLAVNALFALGYLATGGIANARPGSFADAFYFSVQTMGTIGYGAMFPASSGANALVVAESIAGLTLTALATGLIFARFSRPTARVVFSRHCVVTPQDGVPTLMFRIGNERGNRIVDAQIRVTLARTEFTAEGKTFYRVRDLALTRDRIISLSRSWNVLHPIVESSLLHGATAESIERDETELQILVLGLDDTTMQPVHAMKTYYARDIRFGMRLADVLTSDPDGSMTLDLGRFHEVEPDGAPSQPA